MTVFSRICAALLPLFALSGCLFTPGKFTSSLDVRKGGTFRFSYAGEVIVVDPSDQMPREAPNDEEGKTPSAAAKPEKPDKNRDKKSAEKIRAIAEALSKEKGFRSVRHVGGNILSVDYQISGRLDHSFIFPFNLDAKAIIPFVAIEVRADGKVRMQAPGFGDETSGPSGDPRGDMGGIGGSKATQERNGTFTLTTDAEIISQNQEDGPTDTPQGKQIIWTINPLTRAAPMAVLKLAQ